MRVGHPAVPHDGASFRGGQDFVQLVADESDGPTFAPDALDEHLEQLLGLGRVNAIKESVDTSLYTLR